jgi:hypothetical protein
VSGRFNAEEQFQAETESEARHAAKKWMVGSQSQGREERR